MDCSGKGVDCCGKEGEGLGRGLQREGRRGVRDWTCGKGMVELGSGLRRGWRGGMRLRLPCGHQLKFGCGAAITSPL